MTTDPRDASRILIVRLSALGDVVHALPLLAALRRARPRAEIGWLVEERAASLLEGHPQLDRLHVYLRREFEGRLRRGRLLSGLSLAAELVRELRAARYEVALDVQGNLRSGVLTRLSGAPRRVGFAPPFAKEGSHRLLTDRVLPDAAARHKVERNLELLRAFGIDGAGATAHVEVPEALRASARAFAARLGSRRLVALHPGVSDFGSIKRWDPARFAAVARHLRDRGGAQCVVTWGPGDRELAAQVVDASQGAALLAPATPSLLDLAALYERCDVVVGGDTGPIHLAAALGVPVVGLYGPKDPAIYAPWDARTGAPSAAIWKKVACSPCTLRRCPDVVCMPAIQIGEVADAVERAFDGTAPHTEVLAQ